MPDAETLRCKGCKGAVECPEDLSPETGLCEDCDLARPENRRERAWQSLEATTNCLIEVEAELAKAEPGSAEYAELLAEVEDLRCDKAEAEMAWSKANAVVTMRRLVGRGAGAC